MPSQFGGVTGSSPSQFGGGLTVTTSGTTGGGSISTKSLALIAATATEILPVTYGNYFLHIKCKTAGGPQLSCFVGKATATSEMVVSNAHAVYQTISNYLTITWADNATLKVTLIGSDFSGSIFVVAYQ